MPVRSGPVSEGYGVLCSSLGIGGRVPSPRWLSVGARAGWGAFRSGARGRVPFSQQPWVVPVLAWVRRSRRVPFCSQCVLGPRCRVGGRWWSGPVSEHRWGVRSVVSLWWRGLSILGWAPWQRTAGGAAVRCRVLGSVGACRAASSVVALRHQNTRWGCVPCPRFFVACLPSPCARCAFFAHFAVTLLCYVRLNI